VHKRYRRQIDRQTDRQTDDRQTGDSIANVNFRSCSLKMNGLQLAKHPFTQAI